MDPWGGCPEYVGKVFSVNNLENKTLFDFANVDMNLKGKYVKFKSLDEKGSECVNSTNEEICASITNMVRDGSWSEMENYVELSSRKVLTDTTGIVGCSDFDYFYIYDNSGCA